MDFAPFVCKSLEKKGEIRIVYLHPGLDTNDLMISVYHAPLTARFHTAVSYVWGSEEKPHKINSAYSASNVDSEDNSVSYILADIATSFLAITDNLKKLLVNSRHPTGYISLWVDAICIN
ncbi:hypothetical protein QBC37DRAFT_377250 [Rhypophila decipiens]|uniref:Heterokaryon incompatibility domain-containing protein n=1 Tax=Rhypophila decipiens TaxID=261697 RepID=A0AAN6Y0C9_9PEZI|nr:hypothetical protein QBC37DRAFT_377250 [Rhypophila decipiens]